MLVLHVRVLYVPYSHESSLFRTTQLSGQSSALRNATSLVSTSETCYAFACRDRSNDLLKLGATSPLPPTISPPPQISTLHFQLPPEPPPIPIINILPLINSLLIRPPTPPHRRRRNHRRRRRRKHLRHPLQLFPFPLDFADPLAALATDIFGQLDEAEDVLLNR